MCTCMEDNSWIQTLKPGDSVFVMVGGFGISYRVDRVKNITPTGMIKTVHIVNGNEYVTTFSPDGWDRKKLDSMHRHRDKLVPDTQEIRDHIEREKVMGYIKKYNWNTAPMSVLRDVYNALPANRVL